MARSCSSAAGQPHGHVFGYLTPNKKAEAERLRTTIGLGESRVTIEKAIGTVEQGTRRPAGDDATAASG
jgi:hypothetical protein